MSILDSIATVLFGQRRSIAGIIPDVVIEERHRDEMVITDHPVERGPVGFVSDHAYQQPAEVTMKVGWSDSSLLLNSVISGSIFSGITSLSDMYQTFLDLMHQAEPFDLTTGKRQYNNMLIRSLSVTTEAETENALLITVSLREVVIVETQATVLRAEDQASPEKTAPTQSGGSRAPKPASESILSRLFQ